MTTIENVPFDPRKLDPEVAAFVARLTAELAAEREAVRVLAEEVKIGRLCLHAHDRWCGHKKDSRGDAVVNTYQYCWPETDANPIASAAILAARGTP